MTVIAPYTGDPTWDYFDAAFMSFLTFVTAPWVVAVIYRVLHRRESLTTFYCALCLWMFSASWSYDLYLVLRDGSYPLTWLPNIFASSVLYLCGGLLWSLEYRDGRGVIFGFMESEWPATKTASRFSTIALFAAPFTIIVTAMIVPFLL